MAAKPRKMSDLRALVVDDEAPICQLVRYALQETGITKVHIAGNGQDAWNLFREAKPPFDLVICDWKMPQMTGLELLQKIRQAGSDVPFLMLTAVVSQENVAAAAEARVTAYIAKPFGVKAIQTRIRALAVKLGADPDAG